MKIKIDKNDALFSKMIRERNPKCSFCGKDATQSKIENSHFWNRGNKSTRFLLNNCDSLCWYCHMTNEGQKQGFYRNYKLKQLGIKGYEELEKQSKTIAKYGKYEKDLLYSMLKEDYKNKVHLTPTWGGYLITTNSIERVIYTPVKRGETSDIEFK